MYIKICQLNAIESNILTSSCKSLLPPIVDSIIQAIKLVNLGRCITLIYSFCFPLGTRETSYLSAIASASAALAIAKACSLGKLRECSCGHKHFLYRDSSVSEKELFPWRGCQNHILYGLTYSRDFLDPMSERRKHRSIRKLVVKQNNIAGREVRHLIFLSL